MSFNKPEIHMGYRSNDNKSNNQMQRLGILDGSDDQEPSNSRDRRQEIVGNNQATQLLGEILAVVTDVDDRLKGFDITFSEKNKFKHLPKSFKQKIAKTATAAVKLKFTADNLNNTIHKLTATIDDGALPENFERDHKKLFKATELLEGEYKTQCFLNSLRQQIKQAEALLTKNTEKKNALANDFKAISDPLVATGIQQDLIDECYEEMAIRIRREMLVKQSIDKQSKEKSDAKAKAAKDKRLEEMPATPDALHAFIKKIAKPNPKPKTKPNGKQGKELAAPRRKHRRRQ